MKKYLARSIIVAALFSSALSGHADETLRAKIVKERDGVLSQILAEREGRRPTGTADEEAIAAAQLALYSFRRDIATSSVEKIKNQELIVRIYEKKLELAKAKFSTGLSGNIQVLEATVPLLEAKQLLEEIRLNEQHG